MRIITPPTVWPLWLRSSGKSRLRSALTLLVVCVTVAGCAIKLAPSFDQAIFDGLTKANEEAMTLFSAVATGTPKGTFTKRQAAYDSVIGKLDAVRVQVTARASPQVPPLLGSLAPRPSTANLPAGTAPNPNDPLGPDVPTEGSLDRLIHTMTMMRAVDAKTGLSAMLVAGFKMRFEISMEQALTYEKALNR